MDEHDRSTRDRLGRLLFPAMAGFPPAVDDIASLADDSTSLRISSKASVFPHLRRFTLLKKLWCFSIDAERLRELSQCASLAHLFIEGVRVADLSPLARLRNLVSLSLDTAPKVTSLDQLADLDWLSGLAIIHFKSVNSLEPLQRFPCLQSLAVAGSMWTRMTVDSLAPLSTLQQLRYLHLSNLKARDESLEPLHRLGSLEVLECANYYPMEQFARLRAALPHTQCTWFNPVVSLPNLPCKKCGNFRLVMLSGKGPRTLCLNCDEARIRKHEDAFNAIAMGRE